MKHAAIDIYLCHEFCLHFAPDRVPPYETGPILTTFALYNQNRFLTSPEWFFNSGGVWFDSGDVALTREMSGVRSGFYVSRGQKPNWTNVSRVTPKPNHRLRLPRVSTKLNQHLPSIKTKPCVHLPSNQNQIILTPPEYQNQTYLHLPSDKTIP